jgi:hypothetical protein
MDVTQINYAGVWGTMKKYLLLPAMGYGLWALAPVRLLLGLKNVKIY